MARLLVVWMALCCTGCAARASVDFGDETLDLQHAYWVYYESFGSLVVVLSTESDPCGRATADRQSFVDDPDRSPADRASSYESNHAAERSLAGLWVMGLDAADDLRAGDLVQFDPRQDVSSGEHRGGGDLIRYTRMCDEAYYSGAADPADYETHWWIPDGDDFLVREFDPDGALVGDGWLTFDEDDNDTAADVAFQLLDVRRCTSLEELFEGR